MMTEAERALEKSSEKKLLKLVKDFKNTFKTDKKLFESEVLVNIAYCDALFEAGILKRQESEKIKNGLQTIFKRAEFDKEYLNFHQSLTVTDFIYERLLQLVGEVTHKIKIGITDGDLQQTVLRFWLRTEISNISELVRNLQSQIILKASEHSECLFFINKQNSSASPILFAHLCLAYFEMFSRDRERLDEVWRRNNTLPLGSKNGDGTSVEIDREGLAKELNFEGITNNSLDSISDRDFVLEFANASALLINHINTFSEDIIYYSSGNIGFFEYKNENLETVFHSIIGKSSLIYSSQNELINSIKGLTLGFHDNFYFHNKIIIQVVDLLKETLNILVHLLPQIKLNETKINRKAQMRFLDKREIVEYFLQRDVRFEESESIAEKLIEYLSKKTYTTSISYEELKNISELIENDIFEILEIDKIIRQKDQIGGTSKSRVSEAIIEAKNKLKFEEKNS